MTKNWLSINHFLFFIENSIPKNSAIALHSIAPGSSTSDVFIQLRKGSNGLKTLVNDKKFMILYDFQSPFSVISAKTGYKDTGAIYSPVENIDVTGDTTSILYGKNTYSQSNQPHDDVTYTNTQVTGFYPYTRAIVPDSVNTATFIANHKKALDGLPYNGQFPTRRPFGSPIFVNDHNWRTPIYNPEHKNKR